MVTSGPISHLHRAYIPTRRLYSHSPTRSSNNKVTRLNARCRHTHTLSTTLTRQMAPLWVGLPVDQVKGILRNGAARTQQFRLAGNSSYTGHTRATHRSSIHNSCHVRGNKHNISASGLWRTQLGGRGPNRAAHRGKSSLFYCC